MILEQAVLWCAIGASLAGVLTTFIDGWRRPWVAVLVLLAAAAVWLPQVLVANHLDGRLPGGLASIVCGMALAPILFVVAWSCHDRKRDVPRRRWLVCTSYLAILLSTAHAISMGPLLVFAELERLGL